MGDRDYVQYIVVRKDLVPQMGYGKTAAQVAHASLGVLLYRFEGDSWREDEVRLIQHPNVQEWFKGKFTKLVVYVKSKQKLLNLAEKLDKLEIHTKLIYDSCFTMLEPEEPDGTTLTCMGGVPLRRDEAPKCLTKLRLLE